MPVLPSYRNQSIAQINRLVSILGQHWNLMGYCLKHPICNSSNTNNTHTAKVVYVFVSRVKLSTCSSVKNSLRKYTVHRSLASSGISILNSGVAVNSISVRVASPKPCLFVSYLFGDQFLLFFFLLCETTSPILSVHQESLPNFTAAVTMSLMVLGSLHSHLNHHCYQRKCYKHLKSYCLEVQYLMRSHYHCLLVHKTLNGNQWLPFQVAPFALPLLFESVAPKCHENTANLSVNNLRMFQKFTVPKTCRFGDLKAKRSLGENCPYSELFWFAFSRIWYSVSLRIQSEYGKMRTRTTPNMDSFYAADDLI